MLRCVIYFFRQETLATAMQKIMCVLGSFTSDTEVKVCFAILYAIEDLVLLLHVAVLSDFITSFYLIHDWIVKIIMNKKWIIINSFCW